MINVLNTSIKFLSEGSLLRISAARFSYKSRLWTPQDSSSESQQQSSRKEEYRADSSHEPQQQYRREGYRADSSSDPLQQYRREGYRADSSSDSQQQYRREGYRPDSSSDSQQQYRREGYRGNNYPNSSFDSQQYKREGNKGNSFTGVLRELQSLSSATEGIHNYFKGAASESFSQETINILSERPSDDVIEIRRIDGQLYIKSVFYQKILTKAFGLGGWCVIPITRPTIFHNTDDTGTYLREYALICNDRYVSQSIGEGTIYFKSNVSGVLSAYELTRQIALASCCKDIGIGEIITNEEFLFSWREKYADQILCENVRSHEQRYLWKRKFSDTIFMFPWAAMDKENKSNRSSTSASNE